MTNHSIFIKIINKKISAKIIYQDKKITAFEDIKPKAPIHILIVPNTLIKSSNHIDEHNKNIIADMFLVAVNIAKIKKIEKDGYRIIVNCNKNAGQEINHLHMHLLGGKKLNSL